MLARIRLHLEILQAVRQVVGESYPILLRLGAKDYHPGGNDTQDAVRAAQAFESAGVDLLDISGGYHKYTHPTDTQPGYFADASTAIKSVVHIPVLLTGGITQAQQAEALLQQDAADLIGVGRAILKDSQWASNAMRALGA